MALSLFVFNRRIQDHNGNYFKQLVTVAAPDRSTAEHVLQADLEELQEKSDPDEVRFANGGWSIDEILLDEPQVVGFTVVPG